MKSPRAQPISQEDRKRISKLHDDLLLKWFNYLVLEGATYLDQATTDALSITLLPLEWHDNTSPDNEPHFSEPLSVEYMDQLYARTRATDYNRRFLERWQDLEWLREGKHPDFKIHPPSLAAAVSISRYVNGHIGSADDPEHIAFELDWMVCAGSSLLYENLGRDPNFPKTQHFRIAYYLRALPWPQADLPSDPHILERLQRTIDGQDPGDWVTTIDSAIRRPEKKPLVHLGVVICEGNEPCEDRLSRNEMAVAIGAIRDQLGKPRNWSDHIIFPVFVYAYAERHVRVLQVHLDPHKLRLIVRKTPYIHISGPDRVDEIKHLLRWMLAKPTGRTRFDELETGLEDLITADSGQRKLARKLIKRKQPNRRICRVRRSARLKGVPFSTVRN